MKNIFNWKIFNELNATTYRSAASKLNKKGHYKRANSLYDYADNQEPSRSNIIYLEIDGKMKKIRDIIYNPNEKIFKDLVSNETIYSVMFDISYLTDRKSAINFKKIVINGDYTLEYSYVINNQNVDDIKRENAESFRHKNINDLYKE